MKKAGAKLRDLKQEEGLKGIKGPRWNEIK
jgi:hypothetical protein